MQRRQLPELGLGMELRKGLRLRLKMVLGVKQKSVHTNNVCAIERQCVKLVEDENEYEVGDGDRNGNGDGE